MYTVQYGVLLMYSSTSFRYVYTYIDKSLRKLYMHVIEEKKRRESNPFYTLVHQNEIIFVPVKLRCMRFIQSAHTVCARVL